MHSPQPPSSLFLLLLDGPKGAGKSTVSALVKDQLPDAVFLSLDHERSLIPNSQPTSEFNQLAFQSLAEKVEAHLRRAQSVVIDSGLSEERILRLRSLASQAGAAVHAFALIAPYDVLLARVKSRDQKKGRVTDEERFKNTFAAQQSKDFSQFTVLDSDALSPEDIADLILQKVRS